MDFSLVIPTYNRPADVMRLLTSLEFQTKIPDEVIVVDASDNADSQTLIERYSEHASISIQYFRHAKGLTRQRNFGISVARCTVVGFSDDDCVFAPDFFEKVMSVFDNDLDNKIGGASGLVFELDPAKIPSIDEYLATQPTGSDFSSFMAQFVNRGIESRKAKLRRGLERIAFMQTLKPGTFCPIRCRFYGLDIPFQGVKSVDFLRGVAFYRREVFTEVTYSTFFEGYGFGEDVHFSLQVEKRWKLTVIGEAYGYHLHAPSGRPDLFKVGVMSTRNFFYIFRTYKERTLKDYVIFWYFFSVNAFLDLFSIVLTGDRVGTVRLFLGRCSGVVRLVTGASLFHPRRVKANARRS